MRKILMAAGLVALAGFATPASAAEGHWICTGDGIKSWTTDVAATDAHGWKYGGADRTSYKDTGKCARG